MMAAAVDEGEQEEKYSMLPSFTPPRRQCSFSLRRLIIPSSCERIFFWPRFPREIESRRFWSRRFLFLREVDFVQEFRCGSRTNTHRGNILATEERKMRARQEESIISPARAREAISSLEQNLARDLRNRFRSVSHASSRLGSVDEILGRSVFNVTYSIRRRRGKSEYLSGRRDEHFYERKVLFIFQVSLLFYSHLLHNEVILYLIYVNIKMSIRIIKNQ